jgi:hypothetical protein
MPAVPVRVTNLCAASNSVRSVRSYCRPWKLDSTCGRLWRERLLDLPSSRGAMRRPERTDASRRARSAGPKSRAFATSATVARWGLRRAPRSSALVPLRLNPRARQAPLATTPKQAGSAVTDFRNPTMLRLARRHPWCLRCFSPRAVLAPYPVLRQLCEQLCESSVIAIAVRVHHYRRTPISGELIKEHRVSAPRIDSRVPGQAPCRTDRQRRSNLRTI